MPKPICVPCKRFMRPLNNGVVVLEQKPDGNGAPPGLEAPERWSPYLMWNADSHQCKGCGAVVVTGFGQAPHAEHYKPWCERWGRSVADVIDLVVDAIVPPSLALAISTHGAEAQRETADDQSRALAAGLVGRMLADYARRQRNATGKRERAA